MSLFEEIEMLRNSEIIREKVEFRLREFEELGKADTWFSEMCFCLLTANWKAKPAIKIQNELGTSGFLNLSNQKLAQFLKEKGHRFWSQRAERICKAREHINVKEKLKGKNSAEAREWLVENIKGLGYKEASHFLRNVGYSDLAILDRHILQLMREHSYISSVLQGLSKKRYLEIEKIFKEIAATLNMSAAELDLYMWYLKTSEVLK